METLIDLKDMVTGFAAQAVEGTIEIRWGTLAIYVVAALVGLWALGAVTQWMQRRLGGPTVTVGPAGAAMTVIPVTIYYLVLFWLLTGRFITEYVLLVAGIFAVSQIYFLAVDTVAGLNDETKREKINVLSHIHMNRPVGIVTLVFMGLNLLVLVTALFMALMASFRTDLGADDQQARVAIFLFAVPAVSGFVLFMPWLLSLLSNRLTDAEVRGYFLARLLPIALVTSIMLVFPGFLFGERVQSYVPVLPTLDNLTFLPLVLFGLFGLLPFFYSSTVHGALVRGRYQWRRRWLRNLSEAIGNDARAARAHRSLVDEIRRMVRRSPFLKNYLWTLIRDQYPDDAPRRQALIQTFGMRAHGFDGAQIAMIDRFKGDLPHWDRLAAYLDDLFLYFHTLDEAMPDGDRIALWQKNAEDIGKTAQPLNLVSPLVGALVTLASGPLMERLIPYIEKLLDRVLG
ncbi:MAG: hypothetical protein ACFB6R_09715 [Alphaproteobacteria bacterium]